MSKPVVYTYTNIWEPDNVFSKNYFVPAEVPPTLGFLHFILEWLGLIWPLFAHGDLRSFKPSCVYVQQHLGTRQCVFKKLFCASRSSTHTWFFFWRCQDEFCNTLASANQGADQPHRFDQTSVDGFHLTELTLRQTGQAASPRASQVTKA